MQVLSTKDVLGRLRALREEKDLRQGYMARRLGIDRTTYVKKELGLIPITTEEWLKLAAAMKEDPSYFFSFPEGATPAPSPDISSKGAQGRRTTGRGERLLVELYRSLDEQERKDFISAMRLLLSGVRKKTVRDTLGRLIKA